MVNRIKIKLTIMAFLCVGALGCRVIRHILSFLSIQDILSFGLVCVDFRMLIMNPELWKFLVKRDWPSEYKKYIEQIAEKNLESENNAKLALELSRYFSEINETQKKLMRQLESLAYTEGVSSKYSHYIISKYYNVCGTFDDIDDIERNVYTEVRADIPDHPLIDEIDTDPIGLYKRFYSERIVPCNGFMTRGKQKGIKCQRLSVKGKYYCSFHTKRF